MELTVELQISEALAHTYIPELAQIQSWLLASLQAAPLHTKNIVEISIRVVDEAESQRFNFQYRQKNSATNILSFPADLIGYLDVPLVGDLLVCAPVLEQEAIMQNKMLEHHWAHILIHGTLHLLGYDHVEEAQAEIMENLEIQILDSFGIQNPYQPQ